MFRTTKAFGELIKHPAIEPLDLIGRFSADFPAGQIIGIGESAFAVRDVFEEIVDTYILEK